LFFLDKPEKKLLLDMLPQKLCELPPRHTSYGLMRRFYCTTQINTKRISVEINICAHKPVAWVSCYDGRRSVKLTV
jgi:hypothetical protein